MSLATFLALACLALAPADELLPQTPAGWRAERLELPLAFAPELDFDGFEELRFAPGMFEAGSDSYFSYVLALRLQGDLRVDEAFVRELLDRYYTGLARTVARDRGLDLEGATFDVQVERHPAGFLATVDTLDAFVTGEPLRLRCELSTWAAPGRVELFGAVSPLAPDAPIWKELHAIQARWRAARPEPVWLNHLYVVPDEATYAALVASPELRELIVAEERTTVRRDLTYTGFYLYGRDTYFEFLRPNDAFAAGGSGLALGVERPGATDGLVAALRERDVGTLTVPVTRELDGEQLPWFRMLGIQSPEGSRLQLFVLEYDPRFLGAWHPEADAARERIDRAAVLARYAGSLGRGAEHPRLAIEDVTDVHLVLDEAEGARLRELADACGYRVDEGEPSWTVHGPRFRLHVAPSASPGRIVALELALREPQRREPLELGRYRLSFAGTRATLRFE